MYFGFLFFFFNFLFCVFLFFSFFFHSLVFSWFFFSFSGVELSFSFFFDYVSLGFFSAVSFVSMMVFFYSLFYMEGEVNFRRFGWIVLGFVFSMGLLVFSGNFLTLMIGWDGLGLISFCLVIFYSNYSSLEAGLFTVFSNRVGDVFFLSCFLFFFLGELGVAGAPFGLGVLFCGLLVLGAITKSAQIPFSAWLPAAMAAPTPVSSLVHSSTLVTAGVYVFLRFYYVFFFFEHLFIKGVFLFTMVFSGFCACLESDLKKVVAMSTLSQLGLMMFVLSYGLWGLTFFHMVLHAFFKSMLFLNTGYLMSSLGGGQDSRFYGGDRFSFGAFLCFFISSFCLMGFPFFIGFYSKDVMLMSGSYELGVLMILFFLGGCFLTVWYSFRLLKSCFIGMSGGFFSGGVVDSWIYLVSVIFLFFYCWILGNGLYWTYFFNFSLLLGCFDFLIGLVLIFGVFLLSLISFGSFYWFSTSFFYLWFSRWLGGPPSSGSFDKISYFRWDLSWLEYSGAQGVFMLLSFFGFLDLFLYLSIAFLFVCFFVVFLF